MREKLVVIAALALVGLVAAPLAAETVVPGGTTPYAWYRADMGVSTSGTTVTAWADQSGNGRDLTSVTGTPQLTANNTIEFDGHLDYFQSTIASWGTAGAGTVFAVWERDVMGDSPVSTSNVASIYDGNTGAANRQILWTGMNNGDPGSTNLTVYGIGPAPIGGNYVSLIPTPVPADTWVITAASYATDGTLFVNGALEYSGNLQSGGMSGIVVGNYISKPSNGRGSYDGELAELIVFGEVLSAQERAQVEQALGARWGINVVPEPSTWVLLLCGSLMVLARRRSR